MAAATTTDDLYKKYMGWILQGKPYTPPTAVWVGLFTEPPNVNGTGGLEVVKDSNTKYNRVSVPCNEANWTDPQVPTMEMSNKLEITFPVPGTSWGTIKAAGIWDGENAGANLMWIGNIGTTKPIQAGDGAPRILPNQLKILRATCG